jgi:Zn-dependent protease with chaperone function
VLALGLSALLLTAPWLLYQASGRVHAQLSLASIVSGAVILYSVFPRIDRFVAPGPRLTSEQHPALFELIERIARATNQHMPADVYLVADLQAWVTHRGGILGMVSKRVMGLGLPTFEALTVAQLAAVIAHEFGHYTHGDTAIGPWLYKTRAAMGRTLHNLAERESFLVHPFRWYGKMFMRVTTAISRRQEFGADALAARVAGERALTGGLERVHAAGPMFDSYWQMEVVPVLMSGRRPPLAQGFSRFLSEPHMAEGYAQMLQLAKEAEQDVFDTHPPLSARDQAVHDLLRSGGRPNAGGRVGSAMSGCEHRGHRSGRENRTRRRAVIRARAAAGE